MEVLDTGEAWEVGDTWAVVGEIDAPRDPRGTRGTLTVAKNPPGSGIVLAVETIAFGKTSMMKTYPELRSKFWWTGIVTGAISYGKTGKTGFPRDTASHMVDYKLVGPRGETLELHPGETLGVVFDRLSPDGSVMVRFSTRVLRRTTKKEPSK